MPFLFLALWMGYAVCATILAFNRCFHYTDYYWIFEGKHKERFWIVLPFFFTLYMFFFGRMAIYSTVSGALFFNPHVDYYPDPENKVVRVKSLESKIVL
jgi:hypothetical protein